MAKDEAETKEAPAKGSKKKLIIIAVVVLLVLGGVYKFVIAKPAAAVTEKPVPIPGAPLVIEPVNINLADGALLRLGMTLQLTEEASAHEGDPPDPGKALDSAITLFSGRDIAELQSKKSVAKLKAELLHEIEERYKPHEPAHKPGEKPVEVESIVMDLYFTTLVVQAAE